MRSASFLLPALLLVAAAFTGCTLIAEVDRSKIADEVPPESEDGMGGEGSGGEMGEGGAGGLGGQAMGGDSN